MKVIELHKQDRISIDLRMLLSSLEPRNLSCKINIIKVIVAVYQHRLLRPEPVLNYYMIAPATLN